MTQQASTTWATVIALPVAKLQADDVLAIGVTDSPYIFLSFADDSELSKFRIDNDRCIVVRPKSLPPDPGVQAGAGLYKLRLDPVITVSIWSRLWIDQQGQDTAYMHDSSLGIAALQTNVMNSLEQYMPITSGGNYYFIQPMRMNPAGWQFPIKRVAEWGICSCEFNFPFEMTTSVSG